MAEGSTLPVDSKRCPSCAEQVRAEAVICRYCHFDFRTGAPYPVAGGGIAPQTFVVTPNPPVNGFAVASLVLGILGTYGVTAILALFFGYRARRQIDQSEGKEGGRGLAVAGIVLGWVMLPLSVFVIWYMIWFVTSFPRFLEVQPTPL
jgi:Domain of unknown function (DUF4190)